MNTLSKNQQGFGAVEAILIVVLVALLGVGGYMVYKKQNKTTTNSSTTKTTQTTNSTTTSGSSSVLTEATAARYVTDFYTQYNVDLATHEQSYFNNLVKKYGTSNLIAYYQNNQNGTDPIVCAQAQPEKFSITQKSVSNGVATLTVTETFGTQPSDITVKVVNQNGLKIDALTCPTPLPASGSSH